MLDVCHHLTLMFTLYLLWCTHILLDLIGCICTLSKLLLRDFRQFYGKV